MLADRFIICHNPEQAERDAAVRERLVTQLTAKSAATSTLSCPNLTLTRNPAPGQLGSSAGVHRERYQACATTFRVLSQTAGSHSRAKVREATTFR